MIKVKIKFYGLNCLKFRLKTYALNIRFKCFVIDLTKINFK